jgi:hypothetical protein
MRTATATWALVEVAAGRAPHPARAAGRLTATAAHARRRMVMPIWTALRRVRFPAFVSVDTLARRGA